MNDDRIVFAGMIFAAVIFAISACMLNRLVTWQLRLLNVKAPSSRAITGLRILFALVAIQLCFLIVSGQYKTFIPR